MPRRHQRRWPAILAAAAVLVAMLAGGYFHVLPVAARWAAFAMPANLEARMGEELLATLDRHFLHGSRLDAAQRARISDRFARAAAATAPGVPYRLESRTGIRRRACSSRSAWGSSPACCGATSPARRRARPW
jgi:hypothetical protein